MKKPIIVFLESRWFLGSAWGAFLVFIAIVIPGLVVKHAPAVQESELQSSPYSVIVAEPQGPIITVFRTKEQRIIELQIEDYVRGVVAAEMPIEFSLEALKAQALAARTYIVRRMLAEDTSNVPVPGALVTDTVIHQAYASEQQLKERWGRRYNEYRAKLEMAVQETSGKLLLYQGEPIQAAFFSTSNGFTENSEEYWKDKVPYLRSVPSPWDQAISPRYESSMDLTTKELSAKLGLSEAVTANSSSYIRLLGMTSGGRIQQVRIGGKTFTGREIREKLGLPSSHFSWKIQNGRARFTTYGYGHGVGMSQYGAQGMALEGKTAEEIVTYYYSGIEIGTMSSLLK
jgi:stage II sporulation protein D